MDSAPPTDARPSPCEASPVGLCIARLRKKRSQRSCLDCRGGRTPESSGTGGFNWPVGNLAVRTKSQTDLAGNEDIYFCTSRSLPHWIGQREGLARSQCGERSKLPRGVLNMFPSETGELN
jgi:hypothetical protein